MTLRTRLFGKRIGGKSLRNLVKALGENPDEVLNSPLERWSTENVHGNCNLTPVEGGINVDLYVFRRDIHFVDGTISWDKSAWPDKYFIHKERIHLTGKIPYNGGAQ